MDTVKQPFCIAILLLLCACGVKNNEPKYREHQTYSEFLDFLKKRTDSLSSEFEKTTYIREKTAELIDGGFGVNDVAHIDNQWASWTGERYYTVFLCDSATVTCGGSAHFLNQIYRDLGYKSVTYDMGCDNSVTHQLVLVWNKQVQDYIIQDAFFNVSLKNKNGQPVAFAQLIALLAEYKAEEIIPAQSKYEYIPGWDTTGIYHRYTQDTDKYRLLDFFSVSPYSKYLSRERKYEAVSRSQSYIHEQCLLHHRLADNPLYLFLLPKPHNDSEINNIVKTIIQSSEHREL